MSHNFSVVNGSQQRSCVGVGCRLAAPDGQNGSLYRLSGEPGPRTFQFKFLASRLAWPSEWHRLASKPPLQERQR